MPASPPHLTDPLLPAKCFCPKQASDQAASFESVFQRPWHKGSGMWWRYLNVQITRAALRHFPPLSLYRELARPSSCAFQITMCQTQGGNPFLPISKYLLNSSGLRAHQSRAVITRCRRLLTCWLCNGPASGMEGLGGEGIIVINSQFRLSWEGNIKKRDP